LIKELEQVMSAAGAGQIHTSFLSLSSEEWQDWVFNMNPAFILLSDAEKSTGHVQQINRNLLAHCLCDLNLRCVFLESLEFEDGRTSGFATRLSMRNKPPLGSQELEAFMTYLITSCPQLADVKPEACPNSELPSRLQLCVSSVAGMLKAPVGDVASEHLARAFVLHAVTIEQAALSQRAFNFCATFDATFSESVVCFLLEWQCTWNQASKMLKIARLT